MKKQFILTALFLISVITFAQVPDGIKYQTIIRDNSGNALQNQVVALRLSILVASATGSVVYSERQQFTTNDYGLVSLNIGNGSRLSGNFTTINWASGVYFLKVEVDIAGGSNYILMGTSQLLSVPFAKYANLAGKSANDLDTSKVNELQNLSYTAATRDLVISSGTGATLPLFSTSNAIAGLVPGSTTGSSTVFLNGAGSWTSPPGSTYAAGSGIALSSNTFTNTGDLSSVNELQNLSYAVATRVLDISNGTGVTLPIFTVTNPGLVNSSGGGTSNFLRADGTWNAPAGTTYTAGTGLIISGTTFSANNTSSIWNANQLQGISISTISPSNTQVLKWNGNAWSPAADENTSYGAGTGLTLTGNTFSHISHSGDATGSTSLTVVGLQGSSVSTITPATNEVLKWNGTSWTPASDDNITYGAGTGITLSGNTFSHTPHSGDATGSTSLTVVGLQGRAIATTTPSSGSALVWNGSQWAMGYTTDSFNGNRAIRRTGWTGVSGVNVGTTTNITDFINSVFFPFVSAVISINSTGLYEVGTSNSVTISGATTLNDETVYSNGRVDRTYPATSTIYTFGSATSYSTTVSFVPQQSVSSSLEQRYVAYQSVGNNGSPTTINSSTKLLQSFYPYLYGLSSANLTTGGTATYTAMNKIIQTIGNKTVSLTGSGYIYFCFPASYGSLTSIIDQNSFEQISAFTRYNANITSTGLVNNWTESYYIYKSNNQTTASGFYFQFRY
jgi:hypothetical protein